jgi:hypothetical protein
MLTEELKWSKTRVQCPYCDGWYTKQGILGHIRFRHPDRKKKEVDVIDALIKSEAVDLLVTVRKMMEEHGQLSEKLRNVLLDMMLIDYLEKLATRKG